MTLTLKQQALWANRIQRDCLLEAGDDVDAGLAAAEYILSTQPIPLSVDAEGHEHKGAGEGGGQFTSKTRTVGKDWHGKLVHGTTEKSAKHFIAGTDLPDSDRSKTYSEWGEDVIYTSDHDAPHQALMFAAHKSQGKGGKRLMMEFQLKPGSKVIDLADELTRRPAWGFGGPELVEFKHGKKPSFTDDMVKWLEEKRKAKNARQIDVRQYIDPEHDGFTLGEYLPLLKSYAKDRGFAAIRLYDETVIVDRSTIESARKMKPKEVEELKQKPKLRNRNKGGLYSDFGDDTSETGIPLSIKSGTPIEGPLKGWIEPTGDWTPVFGFGVDHTHVLKQKWPSLTKDEDGERVGAFNSGFIRAVTDGNRLYLDMHYSNVRKAERWLENQVAAIDKNKIKKISFTLRADDGRQTREYEIPVDSIGLSLSIYLAHDIHNIQAQSILNRSLKTAKGLSAAARKDLTVALKRGAKDSGEAILKFVEKYRLQLAKLLSTTQLASLLEGAREVATGIPTLATFPGAVPPPPSLEPREAVALVGRLEKLTDVKRAEAVYKLTPAEQQYVTQALAAKEAGGPTVPPTFTPPAPSPGAPEGIHFPTIDEAVKQLAEKNVMTREQFDALDAAAKAKSFAVAGVDAQDTLTKIRDVLAENVREGADYETFKSKVMDAVDQGTFLSEAHLETVFRTNVQSAFSDGQEAVLNHPLVRSGFPYRAYDAIHDDRVRENHLALEKLGLQQTNVYRADDPVFQLFRPNWDYNCRCSSTALTVRQAAEAGVEEAAQWLETGVEPFPPAHVPMPPFAPPPGFQRAVASAPLSIRLSLQPLATFSTDAEGHQHKGKGEGGGQFTGTSSGSSESKQAQTQEAAADYKANGTKAKAFKEWFGDWEGDPANASKVVDEDGKPLVVYHGSGMKIEQFRPDDPPGMFAQERFHMFDTDPAYPSQVGKHLHSVYLNLRNPLISNSISGYDMSMGTFTKAELVKQGYDGLRTKEGYWVAFEPTQIKAVDNAGTFDPKDTRIAFSMDAEGHQHKGKGEGGGQFTGQEGSGSDTEKTVQTPEDAAADYKAHGTKAKAFKAWFGDWENDPANASKVINTKGEPQNTHNIPGVPVKVFHGSPEKFDAFSKDKIGTTDTGWYGAGIYFTTSSEVASSYTRGSGNIVEAYLTIRNPFRIEPSYGLQKGELADLLQEVLPKGHVDYFIKEKTSIPEIITKHVGPVEFTKLLQSKGYDGVQKIHTEETVGHNSHEWIAFEPHQIKSVDNTGTFDPKDTRIAFSIDPDDYPRDKANRFLDKYTLVEAANEPEVATELRESIPEEQRWKLDRAIAHLQSGGTIHRPSEPPGLGIGIDGDIPDPRWAEYANQLSKYEEWVERDANRAECRKCVERVVKLIRKDKVDLDEVDDLLKEAGATGAELRALSRMRHRVEVKGAAPEPLEALYEEVAESIHSRLDMGADIDPKPDEPTEPAPATSTSQPMVAFGLDGHEGGDDEDARIQLIYGLCEPADQVARVKSDEDLARTIIKKRPSN